MTRSSLQDTPSIAFLSDYIPRRCGIATFTHDLCEAVARQAADKFDVFTVAMNDVPEGYPYPQRVRFEVRQSVQSDYRLAAEFLNIHQVSVVCMQHEYGIYGGVCGAHVLGLLRRLRRPLVITLHTVLREPSEQQRYILKELGKLAMKLVVMSETARGLLHEHYDVPDEKVAMIPHGIPDVPFVDPNFYKDKFSVEGRKVMLTFGLISPGKGIEYALEAMPRIIQKHPEAVYVVLGETHPHIRRASGEEYRNGLLRRAGELGVAENVLFVNRFIELSELCEYLGMADIYVTPYLNLDQIVSGTLAYALGTGKATVSTPYWYAKEMLADGRGRLVAVKQSEEIAEQVIDLLDHEVERHALRKRAYTFCRKMVWQRVAQDYLDLFAEAGDSWSEGLYASAAVPGSSATPGDHDLPEVDLRHLRILTDHVGVIRHSLYATPDRSSGYRTDDNAGALVATAMHWQQNHDPSVLPLLHTYLGFLAYAMDDETGEFRGLLNYDRTWSDEPGGEECHARAVWALGMGVALCPHEAQIALCTRLFMRGLGPVEDFTSPRAWAMTIVGLHAYLRRFGGDSEVRRLRASLSQRLADLYKRNASNDWPWFEPTVAYAAAKLPHALLMSGKWMQRGDWIDIGKRSLDWLVRIQSEGGMLSLIGNDGWYPRGGEPARFDQTPAEAHALVDACVEAYHVTRESHWMDKARLAFHWFLGDNDLRTPLYDFTTGGCRDGLHNDRVNENQGAEGTLSFLTSHLLIQELEMEQNLGAVPTDKEGEGRPVSRPIRAAGPVRASKG